MNANKKPEVVSVLGRKMRVPNGQIGVLEKITLDHSKTKMTYHVRTGEQVWALPANKVTWA